MEIDFDKISDTELDTFIAKSIFELTDEQLSEVTFIFWLIYFVERKIKTLIPKVMSDYIKAGGFNGDITKIKGIIECCMDEMTLLSKVKVVEGIMDGSGFDISKYTSYCKTLNEIRNKISHNRIEDLKYKGKLIKLRETKKLMIKDLINSLPKA